MSLRRGPIAVAPLCKRGCLYRRSESDRIDNELLRGYGDGGSVVLVVETEGIAPLLDDLQSGWWISHNLKT